MFSTEKRVLVMALSALCPIAFWIGCSSFTGTPLDWFLGAAGGWGSTYIYLWLIIQLEGK